MIYFFHNINTINKQTGATALHVASAKGYLKVMGLLMQGGAAVNSQGNFQTK